MEKFHEEGLPDKLLTHLEEEIHRDPELYELEKRFVRSHEAGVAIKLSVRPKSATLATLRR
jgi:hypothetical protein